MAAPRPAPVGHYHLLQDFENASISIRVIRMEQGAEEIGRHVHRHSAQVYVGVSGRAAITVGDNTTEIGANQIVEVPAGTPHATRPVGGTAVVMNISVPPLAIDDQVPEA